MMHLGRGAHRAELSHNWHGIRTESPERRANIRIDTCAYIRQVGKSRAGRACSHDEYLFVVFQRLNTDNWNSVRGEARKKDRREEDRKKS